MDDSENGATPGRAAGPAGAGGYGSTGGHGDTGGRDTGGVPDRDRHRHSIYMTGVLARALTAQLEDLVRTEDDAGWWFARSEHRDGR